MKGYKIGYIIAGLTGILAYGSVIMGLEGLAISTFVVASCIGLLSYFSMAMDMDIK